MGVEKPSTSDQLKTRAVYLGIRALTPVIDHGLERIAETKPVIFVPGSRETYIAKRKARKKPIFYSNHTAQEDANSWAVLMDEIFEMEQELDEEERIVDARLPLAQSLDSGAQGPEIQGIYHAEADFLDRHHVRPLNLVRAVDVNEITRPNFDEYKAELMESLRAGSGIVFFPEGNTMGGKRSHEETDSEGNIIMVPNPNNRINGMHHFQENAMRSLILLAKRAGLEPFLVPVGIEGGFRLQVPETKRPSRWALRIGLGFSDRTLVRIKVGMPIDPQDGRLGEFIREKNWDEVDRVLEREVAALLPRNHRGEIKEAVIFPGES